MLARNLIVVASLIVSTAHASPIVSFTESLTAPQAPVGSVTAPITLAAISPVPSQYAITGAGYTVTFSGTPVTQGVVQGTVANSHAVPVAGVIGGTPEYLTGDSLNGPLTTNIGTSGNYLSTGDSAASITIAFTTPQTSFAFLAGSIDSSNIITLSNGDTLIGTQLQAVPGFSGNGAEGFGGSAYVALSDASFTSVTLSSGVISFEIAGAIGSNTPFVNVPEPMSLAVLGVALSGLAVMRRRLQRWQLSIRAEATHRGGEHGTAAHMAGPA